MKDDRTILVVILVIMFGYCGITRVDNTEKSSTILKAWKIIQHYDSEKSVLYKENCDQAHINLILRNHISDREERKLRKDTVYMNLVAKRD